MAQSTPRSAAIRPSHAGPPTRTFSTRRRTRSPRSSPALSTPTRGRRRATHWQARRSGTRSAHRSTAATAARAGGGSSTNRSCTWTRRSSCLTSRAGVASACRNSPTPRTSRWLRTGCAKCSRARPARSTCTRSAQSTPAKASPTCGSSIPRTAPSRRSSSATASGWLIATAADDDSISIRPFDAITFSLGDLWR